MERRLYRSRTDRMVWGVCGGLAKYLDIDPTIVRVIAILLALANGTGILVYVVMAIVVPPEGSRATRPGQTMQTMRENLEEIKGAAVELGQEVRSTVAGEEPPAEDVSGLRQRRRWFAGITIIAVGLLILLANFNLFWWFHWSWLWPLAIIAAGVLVMITASRSHHD